MKNNTQGLVVTGVMYLGTFLLPVTPQSVGPVTVLQIVTGVPVLVFSIIRYLEWEEKSIK